MRLLILGGTGPLGILVIRKVLESHPTAHIVIYARSPEKLPAELASNTSISITKGDLSETVKLSAAADGVDVVPSTLGPVYPHPKGAPIANAYSILIKAMK